MIPHLRLLPLSLLLAVIEAFSMGILESRHGYTKTQDNWFLSIVGLLAITHVILVYVVEYYLKRNYVQNRSTADATLVFKSNNNAFVYASKFFANDVNKCIDTKQYLVGIIKSKDSMLSNGSMMYKVSVAGNQETTAYGVAAGPGPALEVGDLVGWGPSSKKTEGEIPFYVGFIVAKLAPEIRPDGTWKVLVNFTSQANAKPQPDPPQS